MFAVLLAAVGGEHPSKIPFYIAGGLLVAFALVVSAVGVRSETFPPTRSARIGVRGIGSFPSSKGQTRGVIGLAALLVAFAAASAIITA